MSKPTTFELGTAIKITTILSIDSPTSVKITIKDPSNVILVNNVAMTVASGSLNIYTYIYQSSVSAIFGNYKFIIDAVYTSGVNQYTSRVVSDFLMVDTDE